MQYNSKEFEEILNIFKNESDEIIQGLNDGFLELEKNTINKEPIKKLLQLAHSLKGAARMLGFNNIQTIAHKLEDILSYWKTENTTITPDFFQIAYEACDYLSNLIEKAVIEKNDYESVQTREFIKRLNNFVMQNHMVPVEKPKEKKENKLNKIDVNAIILELIFVLQREPNPEDIDEIFMVIIDNLTMLSEIFGDTGHQFVKDEINKIINNISSKDIDLNLLKDKISNLQNMIYAITKEANTLNENSKKTIELTKYENSIQDKKTDEINETFNYILTNIPRIKYEQVFINKIIENLKKIQTEIQHEKINNILNKTINILEILNQKETTIDNDCYIVVLQCIYFAKRIFSGSEEQLSNLSFFLQRLNLVEEILKSTTKEEKAEVIKKQETEIVAQPSYESFQNNITTFDIQEIKTLRVDISKLDKLIAQTNELLINGIKNREHVVELSKISTNISKWSSESKKILNYMKYYEKKEFFTNDNSDMSNLFFKKIQHFFAENIELIEDLSNDFTNLYNLISEDDNKLHQTALEIESIAKGIRVLPLAAISHSFPRMVRDIAKENNKKIDFIMTGSDTTVDKKIIEEIKMPLLHIIRNSISHGIEVPEERIKNNKPETGIIRVSAKQAENNVIIKIEDDGYGINLEKVKEIAVKKGILLKEEIENLSNEQIMKLIFLPGFSTKESINDISGRGVGLDVVKTKISNLNGDILIDSVLNKGCTVTIRVPLSMSTIKTFIVNVKEQKYALPINAIKLVKRINKDEIFSKDGQNCVIINEQSLPIYKLTDIFENTNSIIDEDFLTVVILKAQDTQVAFIVDQLLGAQEVFQKKLVPPILKIKNLSGFTTLPTGETCLIINPYELIRNTVDKQKIQYISYSTESFM